MSLAVAEGPAPANLPAAWTADQRDRALAAADDGGRPDTTAEIASRKSYWIPAGEILGFNFLLNLYDRHVYGDEYATNAATIRRNLHRSWVVDSDPFSINQLGHPYQGSMYFGFARSAGLDYWTSLGYSFAGSAMWEIAGETNPPSRNDLINTGLGGSYYSRVDLGFSSTAQNESGTSTTKLHRNEALADFAMDYGLPGKPGYTYHRPFDYFAFQATASSANGFENLLTRGLLIGSDYEVGPDYRGVWGLYGVYDYIAPQTYRVSSTALALGTTGQSWLSPTIALQGTALLGAGYAAVGTTHSSVDTDYHYGVAPQALLALRLILGERASLDVTGREYFVSSVAGADRGGHDNIVRLDAAFTVRVYKQHAISVKYLGNRRDASDPNSAAQSRGTVGLFYTYVGHDLFGAVEWPR